MNSFYCSPSQIKVTMGDSDNKAIKIDNYAVATIPEGAMINGIIADEEAMINVLASLTSEYVLDKDDSYLVIDSNSIMVKTMDVPPVSENQIVEFIEREFSQYNYEENQAEKIYDYTVINPQAASGGATIMAVGVSKGLIESYRTVFVSAGINLKGINIGANVLIKLAHFLPTLQSGTFILAIIDGKNLSYTLFNEGKYSLTNKYRLLNMIGTPEWQNEIGDNLSSMIQFNKGQKDTNDIESVHFAGILPEELESLKRNLAYLDIGMGGLNTTEPVIISDMISGKGGFSAGSFLYNIGNLLKK